MDVASAMNRRAVMLFPFKLFGVDGLMTNYHMNTASLTLRYQL